MHKWGKRPVYVLRPTRCFFHGRNQSDLHLYLQRARFIPDELLPYFEQVNTVKAKADFKRDAMASDVTTADVRRKIGKMWA